MNRILQSDFKVVEGGVWWSMAALRARRSGVLLPHMPPPPRVAVLWRGEWAGVVGVIEHGPLLMFEWFVLNDGLPLSVRYAATEHLMLLGKAYAADVGKRPVMVVDRRRGGVGIRKMAERLGFASRNEHLEVLEG